MLDQFPDCTVLIIGISAQDIRSLESETHEPAFFASTPTTYLWAVLEQVAPGMNILNYELVAAFADQVPQCAVIVIGVNALHIGSFES